MVRKVLSIAMFLIGVLCMSAQMPQLTPLPVNPKVKHGVLPNGMSYYIMHNEMPKERANFYIAQKVGSTLEEESQLGLAHFLEHMAFNGTTNYPGKNLLNYLQGKGIRFGADINAYTAFDETVYNINNVPTTDKPLVDSVLLALHDWSGEILLEEAEIDAERGVIQEEWRQRNNAQFRMLMSILPEIYKEYQYQQSPIGKMEVVMNFKPEVLRAYYKKWYRPDQQGIVIVGDIDADEMEKKVIDLFSKIPMPENAAERKYPTVSDNDEPIYVSFTDPELPQPRTTITFKSEKIPFEMRNTVEMYMQSSLLQSLISSLINNRLEEFSHEPSCTYAGAGVYFDDFYVSKTKDSFNIVVIPKKGTQAAVDEVMRIVTRACKTGFTESEYDRVKEEALSRMEKIYNERDKTDNDAFGNELCRLFIDNEPAPGIEKELEIWKMMLPMIPLQAINQVIQQILTPNNMVVVTTEPQKEGFEVVSEDVMIKTVKDAMNAEYEAYVDETITDPLIANLPTPGKIVSVEENNILGFKTYTLSNGVKVVVKSTDFAGDEILMDAYREGGKRCFAESQAANLALIGVAYEKSKKGPFDAKTLTKYLSGKQVSLGLGVNTYTDMLEGSSTVKDLKTLMELIYTSFTNISTDQSAYDVSLESLRLAFANDNNNPQKIFFGEVSKTRYGNNPMMNRISTETLDKANYPEMVDMIHQLLSNAGDYTFIFVGNIDETTFKPLMEQYLATLPAAAPRKAKVITEIKTQRGDVINDFKQPMGTPSTWVYDLYGDSNVPYNMENSVLVSMMGDILDNIYTETLREEEGGTYGASVNATINPNNGEWNLIYFFQTNKDQQDALIKRAQDEYMKLLKDGADPVQFNKVKEAMIKQVEINMEKNSYWMNGIFSYLRGYDDLTKEKATIEGITLDKLNSFMKTVYNGKNRIQVIMEGVQAE